MGIHPRRAGDEVPAAGRAAGDRLCRPLQCRQVVADQRAGRRRRALPARRIRPAAPRNSTISCRTAIPATAGDMPPMALVDMPGYGYATAPKEKVDEWTKLVFDYLKGRVDAEARLRADRFAATASRRTTTRCSDLLDKAAVSYQIVLTKTDKIKAAGVPRLIAETLEKIKQAAGGLSGGACDLVRKERRPRRTARRDRARRQRRLARLGRAGLKVSATPFRQWRLPVGGGPSSKMWPKWPPQRRQWHFGARR